MKPELQRALAALRARRGFDPARYIQFKAAMLDAYLRRSGLRACVVAVSGGVDSAVTLALVREAARIPGSPVARVVAALMPLFVPHGASHQDVALARGREVAAAFDAEVALVDLSRAHALLMASVEDGMATRSTPWAAGQLVSNLRTPALYHAATLLTQQGFPALICGTTNRDEGSYLGFFGKASDGMVDLQLISDLHKSEVFRVGQLLRVPTSVLEATPTGDTFDGRHDELMIGAPYDFVELYTGLLALDAPTRRRLRSGWSAAAEEQFARWAAAVEALHRTNAHKYLGASPAVHLDVLERAVPGGWRADATGPKKPADFRNFVGLFSLDPALRSRLIEAPPPAEMRARPLFHEDTGDLLIEHLLTPDECAALRDEALRHRAVPAGPHGRPDELDPGTLCSPDELDPGPHGRHDELDPGPHGRPDELDPGASVASWRSSLYDEALAGALWSRMAPFLPPLLRVGHLSPCDADGHEFWRVVGVSPLLRLIRYEAGGWLVPHHDGAYDEGDGGHRTLWSVLIHLTDPGATEGGETVFLLDRWRHLPPQERSFLDDEGPAPSWERLAVRGALGAALVFDHRRRHEGSPLRSGQKLVLRADLLFARCGVPALSSMPASGSSLSLAPASGSPFLAGVAACEAPTMLPLERRLGVRAGAPRAQVDQAYREAWERGERDPGPERFARASGSRVETRRLNVCGGKRREKALLRGLGETRPIEAAEAAFTPANSKNTRSGAGFQPGSHTLSPTRSQRPAATRPASTATATAEAATARKTAGPVPVGVGLFSTRARWIFR